MSKYSDPITSTGSLITFDAPSGGVFDSLSVPITPTQDLHGYDHPWPAGGGKNLADVRADNATSSQRISVSGDEGDLTFETTGSFGRAGYTIPVVMGQTYTISFKASKTVSSNVNSTLYVNDTDGNWNYSYGAVHISKDVSGEQEYTKTITSTSDTLFLGFYISAADSYPDTVIVKDLQVELGSSKTSYSPYSNICPISGIDNLSVYVSPTTQQAQATEYAVSFGSTVYAGFADPITGEVKERPQYPSYNGEVLVGPWMSSMDEYDPDGTPTTGAQVVDLGGALATASITPVDILMREGSNNVWVDTSAVITLIYRLLQVDRQTDRTSIGKRAESLNVLGKFSSISKVEVNVTENLFYEAGDSSGRTLTVDCPFGTQAMANNLLSMLQGYVYQPFEARRSIANPATELGDGVTVGDVYGGIYAIYHKCGPLHLADLSAPADEEIDHEYKFTPAAERKIERRLNNMESELSVQAGEISAKVDRQGGDPSSVSWLMDPDVFKVAVDGSDVLTVDENGLTVNGNGTFTGSVQAKNIQYGGSAGTMSGNGITSRSIGTGRLTSGINVSLGNADYSADVFSGAVVARYTKANVMMTTAFTFNQHAMKLNTRTVKDGSGNNVTIQYLGAY